MNKVLILFYHSRKRINKLGTAPVWIRITVNGISAQKSTGIFCKLGNFDSKSLQISNDQYQTLRLRNIRSKIEMEVLQLENSNILPDPNYLICLHQSSTSSNNTLLNVLKTFLRFKQGQIGVANGIEKSTYTTLKNRVANILIFLKETNQLHLQAKDTDQRLTDKLLQWLMFTKGFTSKEFCGKHIVVLISAIKHAVLDRKLDSNPIEYVAVPRDPIKQIVSLEINEIHRIENTILLKCLEKVRDLFLFQVYTGLSYADAQNININQVYEKNELNWIRIERKKTGSLSIVPIFPEAMSILVKYNGITPQISNQKFNLYLKGLAMICGIEKPITSHVARKTFACIALERGMSMEAVSAMLGHTTIRTTQRHYGKVLEGRLAREFKVG